MNEVVHNRDRSRREWFLFGSILCLATLLRIWHLTWGLPEVYEEATPFVISWKFWNWGRAGLNFNPGFFNYPAFTFLVQFAVQAIHYAIGHLIGLYPDLEHFNEAYQADPTRFILLARLVSVVFDLGTVYVVYVLSRSLFGSGAGMFASLLVATSPLFIRQSQLVNVDSALAFFTILSLYFIHRLQTDGWRIWGPLSGLAIGLAASSKYTGALLAAAVLAAYWAGAGSLRGALRPPGLRRLIEIMAIAAVVFAVTNPYILLSPGDFLRDFGFEESHMATGHLGIDPETNSVEFYLIRTVPESQGWAFCLLALGSTIVLARRSPKQILPLLTFLALYLITICSWRMRAERYILPVIPILVIIASYGVLHLSSYALQLIIKFGARGSIKKWIARPVILAALALVVLLPPLKAVASYHAVVNLPDTREIAKDWILKHVPRGGCLATIPVGLSFADTMYHVFPIPFLAVNPERVTAFYDTRWYEDFDLVLGTNYDYARYAIDPDRYRSFLSYYDSLRRNWQLVFSDDAGEFSSGPTIWLYKPPTSSREKIFPADLLKKLETAPESLRVSSFLQNLTLTLLWKGKYEKAIQIMKEILAVEVTNLPARRSLIEVLQELGRNQEALGQIDEWVSLQPGNPQVLALKGATLIKLNQLPDAERSLQMAIRMDPGLEPAYDELLKIYVALRNKEKAIDILSRHLKIVPANSEKAELIRHDLRTLMSLPK